ncbi:hypothetical protein NQ317_004449, partial [Molorchus minor]
LLKNLPFLCEEEVAIIIIILPAALGATEVHFGNAFALRPEHICAVMAVAIATATAVEITFMAVFGFVTIAHSEPPSTDYGSPLSAPIGSYGAPNYQGNDHGQSGHDYGGRVTGFLSLTICCVNCIPLTDAALLQIRLPHITSHIAVFTKKDDVGKVAKFAPLFLHSTYTIEILVNDRYVEHPKSYEFGYQVKDDYTGTDYNRRESSDGNQVRGEYRVALPDGRTQIVTYWADWQSGFHADVRYEGEAQYPEQYNKGGYGSDNGLSGGEYGGVSSQYGAPSHHNSMYYL